MTSKLFPLNPEQENENLKRAVYANRLRAEGAQFSEFGSLLLTDVQYDSVVATRDPLAVGALHTKIDSFELYESGSERAAWLDGSLAELPLFALGRTQARVIDTLQQRSVTSLRDVLIYGRTELLRIPGISKGTESALHEHIENNSYGIEWQKNPSPADIGALCNDLSQIKLELIKRWTMRSTWRTERVSLDSTFFGDTLVDIITKPASVLGIRALERIHGPFAVFDARFGHIKDDMIESAEIVQMQAFDFVRQLRYPSK